MSFDDVLSSCCPSMFSDDLRLSNVIEPDCMWGVCTCRYFLLGRLVEPYRTIQRAATSKSRVVTTNTMSVPHPRGDLFTLLTRVSIVSGVLIAGGLRRVSGDFWL